MHHIRPFPLALAIVAIALATPLTLKLTTDSAIACCGGGMSPGGNVSVPHPPSVSIPNTGGNVRSGASEPAPAGYANSIAEYFRKLSKEK